MKQQQQSTPFLAPYGSLKNLALSAKVGGKVPLGIQQVGKSAVVKVARRAA